MKTSTLSPGAIDIGSTGFRIDAFMGVIQILAAKKFYTNRAWGLFVCENDLSGQTFRPDVKIVWMARLGRE